VPLGDRGVASSDLVARAVDEPTTRALDGEARNNDMIPLLPQLGALLKQHKLASPHSTERDYVFCSGLGTPLGGRNVERRGLRRAADLAGLNPQDLSRLRIHDLRHTFASHLIIDLRLDVAQVSKILGHARPSVTLDTYTHLFDQAAHAADIRERMAVSQARLLCPPLPSLALRSRFDGKEGVDGSSPSEGFEFRLLSSWFRCLRWRWLRALTSTRRPRASTVDVGRR
jgi:hypothetical protein